MATSSSSVVTATSVRRSSSGRGGGTASPAVASTLPVLVGNGVLVWLTGVVLLSFTRVVVSLPVLVGDGVLVWLTGVVLVESVALVWLTGVVVGAGVGLTCVDVRSDVGLGFGEAVHTSSTWHSEDQSSRYGSTQVASPSAKSTRSHMGANNNARAYMRCALRRTKHAEDRFVVALGAERVVELHRIQNGRLHERHSGTSL